MKKCSGVLKFVLCSSVNMVFLDVGGLVFCRIFVSCVCIVLGVVFFMC